MLARTLSAEIRFLASSMLITLAIVSACGPDTAPRECAVAAHDVVEGELFDIVAFGHDFSPFCDAGFQAAQDHAQWVAEAWGEPPNDFDYGLFNSVDEGCWPCWGGAGGCAFATHMSATALPQRHELAHAIRRVPCPTLIEEGWATLYGSHFQDWSTVGDIREAADSATSGVIAGEFYPLAARFVAFLLETRGIDDLKALCELEFNDSESLDSALKQVFDQSLDEIATEFSDYPPWTLGQLRQDQACEGEATTTSPGTWSMNLECGAPGVEGREGGRLVAHHLVELPQDGNYRFRFEAPVDFHVRLELRNCVRDGMASIHYQPAHVYGYEGMPEKELVLLDLPAGVYVFRVMLEDTAEPLALEMAVESWP